MLTFIDLRDKYCFLYYYEIPQCICYLNSTLIARWNNLRKLCLKSRALKVTSSSPPPGSGPVPTPPNKKLPPVDAKSNQQTDEILNSILPPREWTENGQLWVSYKYNCLWSVTFILFSVQPEPLNGDCKMFLNNFSCSNIEQFCKTGWHLVPVWNWQAKFESSCQFRLCWNWQALEPMVLKSIQFSYVSRKYFRYCVLVHVANRNFFEISQLSMKCIIMKHKFSCIILNGI